MMTRRDDDDRTADLETATGGSGRETTVAAVSLVVYAAGGVTAHALRRGSSLVVGREEPADVVVPDRTMSRRHARFLHDDEGRVWVEDLGSHNGTRLAGEQIERATLQGGAEVKMGSVRAVLHVAPSSGERQLAAAERGDEEMRVVGPAMQRVREAIDRLARSGLPVLVVGETGTGKELVARALHRGSGRTGPFEAVNSGAIVDSLLEPTLFGHEKGAFTGADASSPGIFERADGGTVFLDEVAELGDGAQAALLRVLANHVVRRVGGTEEVPVDVRVVAATHRDLERMCSEGSFRKDLLFRLNATVLEVPALRDRMEELEPLAEHFLRQAALELGRPVPALSPEALASMRAYAWPGNVRELRNAMERAVVMSADEAVSVEDLPETVVSPEARDRGADDLDLDLPFKERIRRHEADLMRRALARTGGNKSEAARMLRMPLRTFMSKSRTYDIG